MPAHNVVTGQKIAAEKLERARQLRRDMTPAEAAPGQALRRNKLGRAGILTLTALHYARVHGCPLAALHSTPMAESLYRSLGFVPVADFRLLASEKVEV